MYSLLFLLITWCCAVSYWSSSKIKSRKNAVWQTWLRTHRSAARAVSWVLLVGITLLICQDMGPVSGFCSAVSMIMAAWSLLVLLSPYRLLQWKHGGWLFSACLILELAYSLIRYAR